MKKVLFATLWLLLFFGVDVVNASECDSEDIERLKVLASSITYNADYVGDKDTTLGFQTYNVSFNGISDEVYISDVYDRFKVYSDDEFLLVQSGINRVEVYSKYCDDMRLKTITIDLPKYNIYSSFEECDNISSDDLYVCDPWYQGDINYSIFDKAISDYKLKVEEESKTNLNRMYDLFKKYYYIIIPIIVILIVLFIYLIVRRIKKRNYLD